MKFVEDPLPAIGKAKYAYLKQQREFLEIYTGCETINRYHVFVRDENGEDTYLFKCKEESGWCVRNCVR